MIMTDETTWENEGGATMPDCELCGEPNATYVSLPDGSFLCMNAEACLRRCEVQFDAYLRSM